MQPVRALQSTGKSKACFTWHYAFVKNSLGIAKHISMKMYDYGEYYANKTGDSNIDEIISFYEGLSEGKKAKFMKLIYSIQKLLNTV